MKKFLLKKLFYALRDPKKMTSKHPFCRCAVMATILWIASATNGAHATIYDFENFIDNTSLVNQITGLTFTDATIFTSGVSLNEYDYPPHSGLNVVASGYTGMEGILKMAFETPTSYVDGWFTFTDQLNLQAFDLSQNWLGSVQSMASNVLGSWEYISISLPGISYLTITGASQFTLDDLTVQPVPEPASLLLFASGGLIVAGARKISKRRRTAEDSVKG